MGKLESVQHSAARAISGTWKGISRDNLYAELGWESLSCRRWSRRLALFCKIINNSIPAYTKDSISPLTQPHYVLCNQDVVRRISIRKAIFKTSFYPHCLSEWNGLDLGIRHAPSFGVLKKKLLSIIRPPVKSFFGIQDPTGLSYLTQLRVGLSKQNFHKFKYHFRDTFNPMCPTNDGIEYTEHFLLLCPSFVELRQDLLAGVFALLPLFGYTDLQNHLLMQILLYGYKVFPTKLTLQFVHKSGRFD